MPTTESPEFAVSEQEVTPAVVGAVPVIVTVWPAPTPVPVAVRLPPATHETAHEEIAKPEFGLPALYETGMLTDALPAVTEGEDGAVMFTALPTMVNVIEPGHPAAPAAAEEVDAPACPFGVAAVQVAAEFVEVVAFANPGVVAELVSHSAPAPPPAAADALLLLSPESSQAPPPPPV